VEKLPLSGIRVLALEFMWAGPLNTLMLANLGAEVIKVEHHQARGPAAEAGMPGVLLRAYADGETGERPWNRSGFINQFALGKRSLVLDLTHSKGKEIFLELVKISDVVQDNYSARVMPNFGLDYPDLKKINPGIIMVRQSGFGVIGPYKDYIAGGCPTGVHGGMPYHHGYHGEEPMRPESCIVDPWAGLHACGAVLTALWQRRNTGKGQFIDSGQCESVATFFGDSVLGQQMGSELPPRFGNRHRTMAPHNCYPCRGDDKWIAIAVEKEAEWQALCAAMGHPEWTADDRFRDLEGRRRHQDELDRRIGDWTREHDHIELMHMLQGEGLAAGAVLNQKEVMADPHIRARRVYVKIDHPETGTRAYARSPWQMSRAPQPAERAPLLGEHNRYVLGELLGLSNAEVAKLEEEQVISSRPLD